MVEIFAGCILAFRKIFQIILLSFHEAFLSKNYQVIISSGGGSFINKEIQKKIKRDCISIWLKASKETLINRLKNKKNRPLLNVENFEDTLSLLLNERNAIYEKADLTITIDKLDKVKIKINNLNKNFIFNLVSRPTTTYIKNSSC